jgi:glucokinase
MKKKEKGKKILAGDLGATKTGLALYSVMDRELTPVRWQRFLNSEYDNLTEIIDIFLYGEKKQPIVACLGVAGSVRGNTVRMTNLNWLVNGEEIKQKYELDQVFVVNDLVASIMGATRQPQEQLHTINSGKPDPGGAIAILAPGTGLGEAFLIKDKDRFLPVASEGGHASFAPRNEEQLELLSFLLRKHTHISVEKVCSGLGIANLFSFFAEQTGVDKELQLLLDREEDKTPLIVTTAMEALLSHDHGHICVRVMKVFADILAAEAANLALKTLSTGGLFIGGGLPPRILPFLSSEKFMSTFARGVYKQLLTDIPVHIALDPQAPLLGAAAYGADKIAGS